MMVRSLAIAALLVFVASAARADWEGDLELKNPMMGRRGGEPPKGKVRFKEGRMRMDLMMGPMEMTTIADLPGRKVLMVNHAAKSYSETSGDRGGAGGGPGDALPKCKSLKFVTCMKEQGFKKTGAETVNGQVATIWEGERKTARGSRHEKIWHPDAAGEEFAFVRIESGEGERSKQVNILNWSQASQDAAKFQVPDGYEKSEGFPGLMGPPGTKGMRRHPGGPTGGETTESKEKVED